MKNNHTSECFLHQAILAEEIEQFEKKFPNYCRHCHGWGGFAGYTSVPYGSTTASLPDYDSCHKCVDNGICPRCGMETLTDDYEDICTACGWTPEESGIPDADWCICWPETEQPEGE